MCPGKMFKVKNWGSAVARTVGALQAHLAGRAEAYDGEEAGRVGALFTVTEEEVGAAGGAEVAREDVLGAEACAEELGAVGSFQIEVNVFSRGLVSRGHPIEPLDGVGFVAGAEFIEPGGGVGELGVELNGDFGADFVAARTDGGADSGEKVGGVGGEVHLHLADGFDGYASQGAAPSGVEGGYGAFFRIDEKDGDTVSGLDSEEEAWAVGDRGVPFAGLVGSGVEEVDYVGMDLLEGEELEIVGAECGLEAAAVFEDVFAGVPIDEAEVQDFFAVEVGDAAGFGAEAVEEPGEFGEGGDLEDAKAGGFLLGPVAGCDGSLR
jgi:hypothetical protein